MLAPTRSPSWIAVAAWVAWFGGTVTAQIASATGDLARVVPIAVHRGFAIGVRGSLGSLEDLEFLVDTGTPRSLVDREVVRRLGLAGRESGFRAFDRTQVSDEVLLPLLSVGPIRRTGIRALAADLSGLDKSFDMVPDIVMGMDVLGDACFSVDYSKRRLTFSCRGGWMASAPLTVKAGLPVIGVRVDGDEFQLILDTGTDGLVVFKESVPPQWHSRATTEVGASHMVGTVRVQRIMVHTVSAGGMSWRSGSVFIMPAPTSNSQFDGLLGPRALGLSAIEIDLRRMVFSWRL